jgi:hypothetical protein
MKSLYPASFKHVCQLCYSSRTSQTPFVRDQSSRYITRQRTCTFKRVSLHVRNRRRRIASYRYVSTTTHSGTSESSYPDFRPDTSRTTTTSCCPRLFTPCTLIYNNHRTHIRSTFSRRMNTCPPRYELPSSQTRHSRQGQSTPGLHGSATGHSCTVRGSSNF